jgi:hypothetical protein
MVSSKDFFIIFSIKQDKKYDNLLEIHFEYAIVRNSCKDDNNMPYYTL